ncbi:cation:proton antiporter [Opitutales bacterium]|nr:cation:proton antiporter [Opitutales bacterium]
MNITCFFPSLLASSGGHDYLYGLFFLIIALVIGAATSHFLKKVPLPFTVLLLLIGLGMGGLNRYYIDTTGTATAEHTEAGHAEHGESGHEEHAAGAQHDEHDAEAGHEEHAAGAHDDGLWHKIVHTLSAAITWGGSMDGHLILYVFLPILIFEAGFALDVHTFKKSVGNALYMAGPGIVTATLMTGLCFWGMVQFFGGEGGVLSQWHVDTPSAMSFVWLASMLLGAVASATDPVAVVALLKELGASKKLGTLIEGESLLNDGTAIVAFMLLIGLVTGAQIFTGLGDFVVDATLGFGSIGGAGALVGVLIGIVCILWLRKVFNDAMIEITLVLVTSYAVFFICEHFFHVSGVLGLVALGILMAGVGAKRISPEVAHFMHEFWELAAYLSNIIIFIVVGVIIAQNINPTGMDYVILCLIYLAIHLTRAINIGMFYPFMKRTGYGLPGKDAVVVWWGGLRGAIGLALALVVYSESFRYEFKLGSGGEGYNEATTSVFIGTKVAADHDGKFFEAAKSNLFKTSSQSHAQATISHGKITGISQDEHTAEHGLGSKTSAEAMKLRDELASGEKVVIIVGEGSGAVATASLVGISSRVRDQFLFYISGVVLLTLLINATTVKPLVNGLGLTKLPAVKKLMFSNASGNVAKGCEQEMNLLKDDRFLGGANWGEVRKYLPEPVAYPLTADEVAGMDTLAETRRRLLQKESSSYWSQFREGLLSAQGVALLDNNLSEFLDLEGKVPLTQREYLDKVCGIPKLLEALKNIPVLKGMFVDRLTVSYDSAKAFVVAQQDVAKMVDGFASDLDESGDPKQVTETANLLKNEIRENRLHGLNFLKEMHEAYPEVTVGIETKDAIRSVLNHERNTIKKLRKAGSLEGDESDRLLLDVEERMKDVMESSLELRMPSPEEVLREVTWLKGLPDSVISQIIGLSEQRSYASGQRIMEQGGAGDGMIVITGGSVNVSIGDLVVDIMGRGAVIGEMAVLAGVPRTANVVADTSVTAIWLTTESMQKAMTESGELSNSLWKTASIRFAENLLGNREPYRSWSQIELRRWLNSGSVLSPNDGETLNLYGKTSVLVAGQATAAAGGDPVAAPAVLELAEARFTTGAKVFVREA